MKQLKTDRGTVAFPAVMPVTTFDDAYPLDPLVRPYLPRLAAAVMVSIHYARQGVSEDFPVPVVIDSGGFVVLSGRAQIEPWGESGAAIRLLETQELITPCDVLEAQMKYADIGMTLDLPIPPGTNEAEARRRIAQTMANARWAIKNRRRPGLGLFGVVPAFDAESARECAQAYRAMNFDGIAIGGLVPRLRQVELVDQIVSSVRDAAGDLPLHALGVGNPDSVRRLFGLGVDSVDSSSYLRAAANGKLWGRSQTVDDPSPVERLHLALANLSMMTGAALPLTAAPVFRTRLLEQGRR